MVIVEEKDLPGGVPLGEEKGVLGEDNLVQAALDDSAKGVSCLRERGKTLSVEVEVVGQGKRLSVAGVVDGKLSLPSPPKEFLFVESVQEIREGEGRGHEEETRHGKTVLSGEKGGHVGSQARSDDDRRGGEEGRLLGQRIQGPCDREGMEIREVQVGNEDRPPIPIAEILEEKRLLGERARSEAVQVEDRGLHPLEYPGREGGVNPHR